MKKIFKLFAILYTLITILFGCGEALMDYDINTETPIVESYLQEGSNNLTVKVYSMEVYLKNEYKLSHPIGGLKLTVNNRELTETSSGNYFLDLGADTIRENQPYDLQFEYNGNAVEASTSIPGPVHNLRVEPESLILSSLGYLWDSSDTTDVIVSWDDPDKSYYQVYIESPNTSDVPSLGIFGRRMMQPFKGNTYQTTARDFRSAGAHWIYVYRVNKNYVDLYERISSSDLANPVSSVRNAFGIFTALSVARVRILVYESSE
ncbi:MAG: hypothetical protein LBH19_13830 [Dysgonamonadaceae bacterium]|jgi:hypothetical protein|nr:hypothetical protein [Dysgonamonadaceae bacterium]